jgi:hypothetical protein
VPRRATLVAALLALHPFDARAAEANGGFAWVAPEGCPSSSNVETRIRARVRSPWEWPVRGRVEREGSAMRVELTTPRGQRVLTAPTCEQAAEAVAVIVALAVDGQSLDAPLGEPIPARAEPVRTESPPAQGLQRESGGRMWGVSIAGAVDSASLPSPSPGLAVGVGVSTGALSLGLSATGFLPRTAVAPTDSSVRASVALVDLMVSGCVVTSLKPRIPAEIGACVGGGVGAMPAGSEGIVAPKRGVGVRPQGTIAGRIGWWLGDRALLVVQAGPMVDPSRPPFQVDGVGDVYRPPSVSFRGSAGLEWRFP